MRTARPYSTLLALCRHGVIGSILVAAPASAHEEREAGFPDGTGTVPNYLGLSNANYRVACTPAARPPSPRCPRVRSRRATSSCSRSASTARSRTRSTPSPRPRRRSTSSRAPTWSRSTPTASRPGTAGRSRRSRTTTRWRPATQYIGSLTGAQPAPVRRRPGRAVLRRPGEVPAQPQPDRPDGRQDPRRRLDQVRQPVLRHPARRHRSRPRGRRDRQQVQQAQRHPRRPRRRQS